VADTAPDKTSAPAEQDLGSRLAAVRDRCAALLGRESAAEKTDDAWPRDLNAEEQDGSWGDDPAEVRG